MVKYNKYIEFIKKISIKYKMEGLIMLLAGLDGGNNTVILSMDGMTGDKAVIIPTVYANYKESYNALPETRKDLINNLDVEITLNAMNLEKKKELGRFIVGNLAISLEKENATIRENGKNKTGDEGLLVCMLTTLAYGVIKSQNKDYGRVSSKIGLVTGLPYLQYREDKKEFGEQFIGTHIVKFNGDYDITVELKITETSVQCEGAGALNKSIFNDKGEYKYSEDDLIDRYIMGFDVGEFTSELITMTFVEKDNMVIPEYQSNLCTGIDYGIANAKQPIIDYIRETKNTIVDRYTIDKVIKRSRRKGILDLASDEEYNITNDYDKYLKDVANTTGNSVINKIHHANITGRKIKEFIIFGGGADTLNGKFGSYLSDKLEASLKPQNLIIADNALTANADGYLEKAKAIYEGSDE
jgi:hypothetical protein